MNFRQPTLQDAFALHGQGRVDEAARVYQAIAAREPTNAEARHYLGALLASAGRVQDARALMKRALELKPSEFAFLENYITLLVAAEAFEEALPLAQRAVSTQPRNANALYLLSVCLEKLDFVDEARRKFEALLKVIPKHQAGRKEYAVTLVLLGAFEEASRVVEALIVDAPRFADAYLVRANIRAIRGELGPALADYDRALTLQPRSHEAWRSYAGALDAAGLSDKAVSACDRALALRPDYADAHIARGEALKRMGRMSDAFASFDKAVALGGEKGRVARASALATMGESDRARDELRQVIETFPEAVEAWPAFADLVKFKPDDPELAAMETRLAADAPRTASQTIALRFALGKAYLDIGDSQRAFDNLDAANRLKRARLFYDAEANSARVAAVAAAFPPAIFERFAGAGARADSPIFVVGMPRSGTTLIEQILASHPAIHGAGELNTLPSLAAEFGGVPEAVGALTAEALEQLGNAYVARVGPLTDDKSRFVDKLPANFLNAGLIRLALPNAKIIHSRRDPVDTCLSCYTKNFSAPGLAYAYDMTELGRYYRDYQTLMAHWRAVLPADAFIEVDYEAIVDDLETEARRLIAFLGLDWDPACLEFHRTNRPVLTASVNQVRQPIYRTSAGRWRAHADRLVPLLKALGVEP